MNLLELVQHKARLSRELPDPAERKRLRETAGVTQLELAESVGASRAAVALWESGDRTPRGELLEKYLEALAVLRGAAS